ncbi:MAG: DNA-processing protein DprA [Spirochaetota bacterium]
MIETCLIALLGLPGFGRQRIRKLVTGSENLRSAGISNAKELFEFVCNKDNRALGEQQEYSLWLEAWEKAESILQECQTHGICVLGAGSIKFPERLKHIPNPPILLFAKGNLASLQQRSVAIIGTRTPSVDALELGKLYSQQILSAGFAVVSGLAKGCDTLAHQLSVAKKVPTIAFLPSGILNLYPKSNAKLAQEICESGGCLLSEYIPRAEPQKYFFVERDRLQSGLAQGVFVIETDLDGGSMHTTKFARRQKRKLACIYSREQNWKIPAREGNSYLVASGQATAIFSTRELDLWLQQLSDAPLADSDLLFPSFS